MSCTPRIVGTLVWHLRLGYNNDTFTMQTYHLVYYFILNNARIKFKMPIRDIQDVAFQQGQVERCRYNYKAFITSILSVVLVSRV